MKKANNENLKNGDIIETEGGTKWVYHNGALLIYHPKSEEENDLLRLYLVTHRDKKEFIESRYGIKFNTD